MTQRPLPVNLHSVVIILCFDVNILSIDTALNIVSHSVTWFVLNNAEQRSSMCVASPCRECVLCVMCMRVQGRVSACAHISCAYIYVLRKLMLNL